MARTVQGVPGVMDAQSRASRREGAQVAAEKVEGAEIEAHEEQKWQSFMEKHFGKSVFPGTHGLLAVSSGNSITLPACSVDGSMIFCNT